ncbi:MAG: helix-turn-helix domain-containing protein [Candidatus Woesearchaeota archaeon]
MYKEIFQSLGMSPNEAQIYEALIGLGEASANDISVKTGINRSNVYDAMERLADKGLAASVTLRGNKYFKASHPRRLLELLKEKEEIVANILPDLSKKFEFHDQKEEVYFYQGIEGYKNYMFDILKEGKTYYCIGGKAMWFDPRLKYFRMKFDRERKKSNVQFKHIFDEEVKTKSPEPLKFEKNKYKFLPKKYCSNLTLEFFGDYTVIYTGNAYGKLKEKPNLFVIKSKEISEGFKKIFQFIWDKSSTA